MTETKLCPGCGETKPTSAFSSDRSRRSGVSSRCLACLAAARKARREADPAAEAARLKRYRDKNRERIRERSRAHYHATKTLKGRSVRPAPEPKTCVCCGCVLSIRRGESKSNFARRESCSRACSDKRAGIRGRAVVAARSEKRRQEIRQYLLDHPEATNREVVVALRAHKDTVSKVRTELWPPAQRTPKPTKARPAPMQPQAVVLVRRWDVHARQIAAYLQAGEHARRLFDPAIADAAARIAAREERRWAR